MGEDERTFTPLHRLATELEARHMLARVVRSRAGVASVRVINPRATSLAENVSCVAPEPGGLQGHHYYWSWGETLHPVSDPAGAAEKVARVLAAVGDEALAGKA